MNDAVLMEELQAAEKVAGPEVRMIPLSLIVKSEVALRDVQVQTEDYLNLMESIRQKGVLNSILVREIRTPTGALKYSLIDGLQRFSASEALGLLEIPARIVTMDDGEVLEAQVITNMSRVQTRPADLSKHLLRILARNPFLTLDELASRVCQSRTWLDQRLALNHLIEDAKKLVNEGRINLMNAYILSKLPPEEQPAHVEAAQTEQSNTFVPRMKERLKEINNAKRTGKDAERPAFQPVFVPQKRTTLIEEYQKICSGEASTVTALLGKLGITDPIKVAEYTLAWTLNFDPDNQERQRQEHAKREAAAEEKKRLAKAEREALKAEQEKIKAQDILSV